MASERWTFLTRRLRRGNALNPPGPRRRRLRQRRGFTLIEAALTTVIVGTGVLAIVAAQQAYHRKNDWAQRMGTALMLANEIRELTLILPMHDPITGRNHLGPEMDEATVVQYDDLDDFAGAVDAQGHGQGVTFNPPITALRQGVADLVDWRQFVRVENVLDDNVGSTFTQPLGSTNLMRVTVNVSYQRPGQPSPMAMTSLSWIVARQ